MAALKGEAWHRSPQKLHLEAALLKMCTVHVAIELTRSISIAAPYGYDIFVQDRVDTYDLETGVMTHLPIAKFQTLPETTLPLADGKKAESFLSTILHRFREHAGDESPQILQTTWDVNKPGILALISTRPQMVDEFQKMELVLSNTGYTSDRKQYEGYVERYSRMRKGYASNESAIGLMHQRDSIEAFLARCEANEKYWVDGSAEYDLNIFLGFMALGQKIRVSGGGELVAPSQASKELVVWGETVGLSPAPNSLYNT